MKDKLLALMKNEGLKPSQLAEILEINPAGISHILAGRNKPGFDLLQKILKRFPQIDPDWLLLDSDTMYRSNYRPSSPASTAKTPTQPNGAGTDFQEGLFSRPVNIPESTLPNSNTQPAPSVPPVQLPVYPASKKNIERIVIFYADRTFEDFLPTKP